MILRTSLQTCGRPIVVASHMRSGTHLMIDLLRRQFDDCRSWKWPGEPNDMLYLPLDVFILGTDDWTKDRALRVLRRATRPILKTHWTFPSLENLRDHQPDLADWIESGGIFLHVVRNPFSVLASQWAWDCSLGGIPASQTVPDLPWITTNVSSWMHHYEIWSHRENAHVFRHEDTVDDPAGTLERLSDILGSGATLRQPLLPGKLRGHWHSRWNRFAGVHPASTEILTGGGAPDPFDLFNDEGIELILGIAGEALEALGYGVPEGNEPGDTGRPGRQPLQAPPTRVNVKPSGH